MSKKARLERIIPLLVFVFLLAVMVSVLAGTARGQTSTPLESSRTSNFTVSAKDLGSFALEPPSVTSRSAILVNMQTGKVLFEREANVQRPMASTTKIMTCILVLERVKLDTKVTVSAKAAATSEPSVWLKEGDVLTVDQLLHALMIRSANSAAVALAEECSGSVEEFVALMNAKAQELGMSDTHFINPNGLDAQGHYSTAADMATLARYAMNNETFRELVGTKSYSVSLPGRSGPIVFENTNKLLGKVSWVTGVKTGLTPNADQCLVASGTRDGISVISVVLGQPSSNVCWAESQALMEYGFSQYKWVPLMDQGVTVAEAAVPYQLDGKVELITERAVEIALYKDDEATVSVALEEPLVLPVEAGESYGQVVLLVDGETADTVELVASKSFEETTLGSKLVYYWDRFARWVGRLV